MRVDFFSLWLLAALACPGDPARAQEACPPVETRAGRLADVNDRLEISLEDGARLRLFGVEATGAGINASAAVNLRAELSGLDLSIEFLGAGLDRWGRSAARVFAPTGAGGARVSAAAALIETGQARARVEPGPVACVAPLMALEALARGDNRGLWADPANAAIPAAAREAFAGRDGQIALVEGRIVGVGETATRLYLNFGPIRTVDFSASMSRATVKLLAAAGIDPHGLTGAQVRLRGQIDRRFGPQIEILYPSAIEIVSRDTNLPNIRPGSRQ